MTGLGAGFHGYDSTDKSVSIPTVTKASTAEVDAFCILIKHVMEDRIWKNKEWGQH